MDKVVKLALRKAIIICLLLGLASFPCQAAAFAEPQIEGQGAILLERKSRKVLYAKNENQRLYPASTTKILTALLCLENCDLEEVVTVGEEIKRLPADGSSAELVIGEKLTVMDLLNGLMLSSGNDAANVLAVHVARKLSQNPTLEIDSALKYFVDLMNKRAAEIGALNSHFTNPHGLHDEDHYTTPADLAKIALVAMENPLFRQIVGSREYKVESLSSPEQVNIKVWKNTNKLLDKESTYYFEQATGIKTGFTTPAGYCLVSSASGSGLELIGVVLNTTFDEDRWNDSIQLLKYGLEFKKIQLLKKEAEVARVAVANPSRKDPGELSVLATTDFYDLFHPSQLSALEQHIIWDEKVRSEKSNMLRAPIKEGQELGRLVLTLNGDVLTESTVVAARDVWSNNLLSNIFSSDFPFYWFFWILLAFMLLVISLGKKSSRRNIRF